MSFGSRKDILRSGYRPPENMQNGDKLCKSCLLKIKDIQTKGKPQREKVSLGFQIGILLLGLIIPFVWLYPFYKIEKLGYGLIISLILTVGGIIPLAISVRLDIDSSISSAMLLLMVIMWFGKIPVLFYFLIKWTKEWNKEAI
ncbi:hypothetical protein NsoK4_04040 [Nitrosopumilus sp. K4]|uniref:hypothetical protein n=1 Tax=Nitrosopumilus sp. K4 TaxID=2795383 RepID=UPI001BACB8A7|nr:hypothetical protein [Nitrosopumilus sp. K4]QUC65423.1 hypothetical protein NsoK4_04040 [Nitrosopumilus sp. K4]